MKRLIIAFLLFAFVHVSFASSPLSDSKHKTEKTVFVKSTDGTFVTSLEVKAIKTDFVFVDNPFIYRGFYKSYSAKNSFEKVKAVKPDKITTTRVVRVNCSKLNKQLFRNRL